MEKAVSKFKCPDCKHQLIYLYARLLNEENKHAGYKLFGYWCDTCKKMYDVEVVEKT